MTKLDFVYPMYFCSQNMEQKLSAAHSQSLQMAITRHTTLFCYSDLIPYGLSCDCVGCGGIGGGSCGSCGCNCGIALDKS